MELIEAAGGAVALALLCAACAYVGFLVYFLLTEKHTPYDDQ